MRFNVKGTSKLCQKIYEREAAWALVIFVSFSKLVYGECMLSIWAVVRNPGRDISFPIFIRKEIETRKLERKSKQKISRLIDLLYRLNDIISR